MREGRQSEFRFRTWGGKRSGAGRPPTASTAGVSHLKRPSHAAAHPVHVTLRVVDRLPNLRRKRLARTVVRAIWAARERLRGRVVHFSIQPNHVHLIVEATDRVALSRALQGLSIRIARGLNRVLERRGRVFADRYHARDLGTPLEVRNAIRYVLLNSRHHSAARGRGLSAGVIDGCSSAPWFDGWSRDVEGAFAVPRFGRRPDDEPPVAEPRTWLLKIGWKRCGAIDWEDAPGRASDVLRER
jgi:REP element-mobilizing transposase RayT